MYFLIGLGIIVVIVYGNIDKFICLSMIICLPLHHQIITNNNKDMENLTDIIKGSQLTLVDFYATWCGPCKMMHPVLEQLKKELGDSIRVIKVDIDKNESTAMQMRIQSVPTLMLFQSGEMKWRQSGAMSLADLKATIAKYQ